MQNAIDHSSWILIIRSSNEEVQEYTVKPGRNTLGRDQENDIVLADVAASNRHAEMYYDHHSNKIGITDLKSTNGTYINGKRITSPRVLHHEDQIRIGFCVITVIQNSTQSKPGWHPRPYRTPVTSELILESIDHYGVLLHDVAQRLVNVSDLNKALTEIAEVIKRMIGAKECKILLVDQLEYFKEKGIPLSLVNKVIENHSAVTFSFPEGTFSEQPRKGTTLPAQAMLLVPVMIDGEVVALIFAQKTKKTSTQFYNSDLQLVLAVSNQVAISIQRNRVEGILLHNSTHDSLTDLPNRTLFLERLDQLVSLGKVNKDRKFAVLFFDIDDFKVVNDSFGHATGDKLLVAMAERLKHNVRNIDVVARSTIIARFGGDEFAILLDTIKESFDAMLVADRLKDILARPFNVNGKEIFTTVSIGVAISTGTYEHPEDMLRDADMAMYQAKELGKNNVEFYDAAMHERVLQRMKLGTALRRGALLKEFRLHYQPIISLQTGRIVGFEALLRWYTPDRGILIPVDFMDAIDTAGLVYTTDQWVLENACRQAATWQGKFPEDEYPFISVNLSARNIKHPNLVSSVEKVLKDTGLNPNRLWLEITEKASAANDETVINVLHELRSLGARLSLDDFGTGYSALNYLARFPIDALKIDRSFIKMIGTSTESQKVIEILKALAKQLGLVLIAEGVETADQIPFLKSIECEYVQGFYFARPMDSESATKFLVENL